jgi:hypothetical protein
MVTIWAAAGEGELFRKEVDNRFKNILPKFRMLSVEKLSQ